MSSTEVEYSERIQSAQEQTREERICEKVSIRRSRIVGRSFGLVSMISRTKNTCRPTAAGQALLHTGSQDHSVITIGQKLHHPQGTDVQPSSFTICKDRQARHSFMPFSWAQVPPFHQVLHRLQSHGLFNKKKTPSSEQEMCFRQALTPFPGPRKPTIETRSTSFFKRRALQADSTHLWSLTWTIVWCSSHRACFLEALGRHQDLDRARGRDSAPHRGLRRSWCRPGSP